MALSVADIEAWDADDVREVGRAARGRADALFDAADGLAGLPGLGGWDGESGRVARESLERTRGDVRSRGFEALAVAQAAKRAADSIEAMHAELARITVEAGSFGLRIDPVDDRVVPVPGDRHGAPRIAGLQQRLDSLVEQANSVDRELAAAVTASDGPASGVVDVPLPDDPEQFHDLWQRLSREERDQLYRRDHTIGSHPGMPVGEQDTADADHYNRLHLAEELATAKATDSPCLDDLRTLDDMLRADPDLHLMMLDTSGERLHAAFAVGNPDTAEHVSVTTPGMNTSVADSAADMAFEAHVLQSLSLRQLGASGPGRSSREKVAAIGWLGYDAPQVKVEDGVSGMLAGVDDVIHDDVAQVAARDLSRFYDGVVAAHAGKPLDLTAIGHSYGSLTTGLALQQPGGHGVDKAVFYGSPGIEAGTAEQLQLAPGHVFTMQTPDDEIRLAFDGPPIVRVLGNGLSQIPVAGPLAAALLNYAETTDAGEFGPDPAANPNFVAMETGAASVVDRFGTLTLAGAHGHSDYPQAAPGLHNTWLPRTTNYNLAAVVAGLPQNVIPRK